MDDLINLWDIPKCEELYMIAGWEQWADAGAISSGLPRYLAHKLNARKIGELRSDSFYLFQFPGTHHFLRPEIKLEEGYRKSLHKPRNQFFFSGDEKKGLVIFLGEEPHLNVDGYSDAILDVAQKLGVKRIGAVGGVYGSMPYKEDREVSCVYSIREMKEDLEKYAVRFSNYEGGTTIGTYIVDNAELRGIEFFVFYAFVPAYDFSDVSELVQGLRIENDFKAWYDLMRRFNHMFGMEIDLAELKQESDDLVVSMDAKIEEIDQEIGDLDIKTYLAQLEEDFTSRPFVPPLGDMWERGLRDIFGDVEE